MDAGEHLRIEASRVRGAVTQKGWLVLRPQYAVFAPTEGSVNALGAIAGGMVGAMAGFAVRVIPEQYRDVGSWLAALERLPAADFDAHLWHAAQTGGLWVATPADGKLLFKKVLLFDRFKVWIKRGDENVGAVFGVPGRIVRPCEPMLAAWPRQ